MRSIKKAMIWSLLIIVLVVLAVESWQTWSRFNVSKQMVASTTAFSKIVPDAGKQILVAGDSTAVGVGALDPHATVAGRLARDFPTAAIVNISQSGLKTKGLLPKLGELDKGSYQLVVLQIGGNDILYFTKLEQLVGDINQVLQTAGDLTDGQVILLHSGNIGLAPFFPRWLGWLWTVRTRLVAEIFRNAALDHQATYIDLFSDRANDPFAKDTRRFYAPDMLHPSGDGYGVWYSQIKNQIKDR